MKTILKAFALAAGSTIFPPPCLAQTSKIHWLHLDTQAPTGGIGIHAGPLMIKELSKQDAMTLRAAAGGSLTFKDEGTIIRGTLSPSAKIEATYHHALLDKRTRISAGLSTAYVTLDNAFYGTSKMSGLSAQFGLAYQLTKGIQFVSTLKQPIAGNLPQAISAGVITHPFTSSAGPLKNISIGATHTATQNRLDQNSNTTSNAIIGGYQWKPSQDTSLFVGIACSSLEAKRERTTIRAKLCVPTIGFSGNL